jgi:hypothetical protein
MKQLLSRSLAHMSQRRMRVTWLIVLTLGLLLAVTPIASPAAFAATNGQIRAKLAAPQLVSAARSVLGSGLVTSTTVALSRNSAGNSCKTFTSYLTYGYLGVKDEMWLKVVTAWCYNNIIVTSHSSTMYWGVTSAGAGSGWTWPTVTDPSYSFNCYADVANGIHPCAGNHERTIQLFQNPILRDEASLTIDQYETRDGQASNTFNAHICPGGC